MAEIVLTESFSLLLFEVGIIIVISLIVSYFFKKIGIPAVMGILIGGIVIGFNESFRTILLADNLNSFRLLITELAIGYIAYDIGNEIDLRVWKDRTKKYLLIVLGETTVPFIFITSFFVLVLHVQFGISLILGAIAMTTAPVITSDILGDYHTDEEVSQLILFLLMIDSVISILVINIAITVVSAQYLTLSLVETIVLLLVQKFTISVVLAISGSLIILFMLNRKYLEERVLLEWLLGVSLVILGLTLTLDGSVILTMLFFGIILKTMEAKYEILTEHILQIELLLVPVVLMFYILMGLTIDVPYSLGTGFVLIIAYIIIRTISEFGGTLIATRMSNLPKNIKNNLQYFLITQGGITIALAGLSYNQLVILGLPTEATLVISVVGISVVISQIIGPLFLRFGIIQSQGNSLNT